MSAESDPNLKRYELYHQDGDERVSNGWIETYIDPSPEERARVSREISAGEITPEQAAGQFYGRAIQAH